MPDITSQGVSQGLLQSLTSEDIARLTQVMEEYQTARRGDLDTADHRRMQYDIHGRREILDSCGMPVKAGDLVYVRE